MNTGVELVAAPPIILRMRPTVQMDDDQFFEFCQLNQDLRLERTAEGDLVIMAPTGGESSARNLELVFQLLAWAKKDRTGRAFDSSVGFILPDRAVLSPDAAWVSRSRLSTLTRDQKRKFLPLCPEFAVELRSPTDRLADLKRKMEQFIRNGARLGWVIDPEARQVFVFRPHRRVEQLDQPERIAADPELPGFVLELAEIWDPEL